jgi:hypothetical protein
MKHLRQLYGAKIKICFVAGYRGSNRVLGLGCYRQAFEYEPQVSLKLEPIAADGTYAAEHALTQID